jgi:hypothetical protein
MASSSIRQQLIPLRKDEWAPLVVSEQEELYQERWGEYKSWWYDVQNMHVDQSAGYRFDEIMGMVYHSVDDLRPPPEVEQCPGPGPFVGHVYDAPEEVDVCKSCRRIFEDRRVVGTWNREIPEHQYPFKCAFCGPPLPAGKQSTSPVMFQRWADYNRVTIGKAGGSLTILHATYGGPSCPDRDVTDKVRRLVEFQRANLGYHGYIDVSEGIHLVIGDPEPGIAKVFRVWFVIRTSEQINATLQRLALRWREKYYAPGGKFEFNASQRFKRLCSK